MGGQEIEAIRARRDAATPGPWKWGGNTSGKVVNLFATGGLRDTVMTFWRWGTQSAMPVFRVDGMLLAAKEFFVKPQSHNPWFIDGIDHPDAIFIEHAREDVDTLLAEVDRLREVVAWHETTQCQDRCCAVEPLRSAGGGLG